MWPHTAVAPPAVHWHTAGAPHAVRQRVLGAPQLAGCASTAGASFTGCCHPTATGTSSAACIGAAEVSRGKNHCPARIFVAAEPCIRAGAVPWRSPGRAAHGPRASLCVGRHLVSRDVTSWRHGYGGGGGGGSSFSFASRNLFFFSLHSHFTLGFIQAACAMYLYEDRTW